MIPPRKDSARRGGFSLLELMIAIMILGIGVVMVATVFPVGLEITRQTIQMSLAESVADAAAGTLQVKVPAYRNLNAAYVPGTIYEMIRRATPRVLVPEVEDTDSILTAEEAEVVSLLYPASGWPLWPLSPAPPISYEPGDPVAYTQPWIPSGWPGLGPLITTGQTVAAFVSHTRVFTERTGWTGERVPWTVAQPIDAQNLPSDPTRMAYLRTATSVSQLLDRIANPSPGDPVTPQPYFYRNAPPNDFSTGRCDLPRVSLVDQMYPPVDVSVTNPDGTTEPRVAQAVMEDLLSRRYLWLAFHHRMMSEDPLPGQVWTNRDMLVTVALLHRADLNARFARQGSLESGGYVVDFDLTQPSGVWNNPDHVRAALRPQPDADRTTFSLLPRPWLAMIGSLDESTGQAEVTAELARVLPAGSFVIVAETTKPEDGGSYLFAGVPLEVIRSRWDPGALGMDPLAANYPWSTVELTPSGTGTVTDVPVWVFPPAVDLDTGGFQTRGPVAGVTLRGVAIR